MAVATLADVRARVGRVTQPEEDALLIAKLADAEAAIMVRLPDTLTRVDTDPVFRANVIAVECDIAIRASGLARSIEAVSPAPGVVTETGEGRPSSVTVRREEWRRLGVSAYDSVNVTPPPVYYDNPLAGWTGSLWQREGGGTWLD